MVKITLPRPLKYGYKTLKVKMDVNPCLDGNEGSDLAIKGIDTGTSGGLGLFTINFKDVTIIKPRAKLNMYKKSSFIFLFLYKKTTVKIM